VRLIAPATALSQAGHRIKLSRTPEPGDVKDYEVFVFAHPQASPALLEALKAFKQAGKRVVVDLDVDFHRLSADHPRYAELGPGNPASLLALEAVLAQADLVTVSSPVLAERYRALAKRILVAPAGWQRANPLWDKPSPRHSTLNIGWIGGPADVADLNSIKSDVIHFVRQLPEALLVLGGEPAAYSLFDALPEQRRLFLPLSSFDDYPFMLAHFDISLAPLRDVEYNQAKSDAKLLEAGIRHIPWVASPISAYAAWGAGGLWADKPGEWLAALKKLANEPALRKNLGEAGRQKAETRESAQLVELWRKILDD
jgi:glycosyltransferase involved in cell wall biosynthesis